MSRPERLQWVILPRKDGCSGLYPLGAVLYELLAPEQGPIALARE